MNDTNQTPKIYWLATEKLPYYSDSTEPTKYPNLYTALVRLEAFDAMLGHYRGQIEELKKENKFAVDAAKAFQEPLKQVQPEVERMQRLIDELTKRVEKL